MKLLFDQNISFRITKKLKGIFLKSKHVSDCGLMDCEDSEIWDYARNNRFTIVTFDADFYDISIINGSPPKIIWLRTGNITTNDIIDVLVTHQQAIQDFILHDEFQDIACLEIE